MLQMRTEEMSRKFSSDQVHISQGDIRDIYLRVRSIPAALVTNIYLIMLLLNLVRLLESLPA